MLTRKQKENLFTTIINLRTIYGPKVFNMFYKPEEYTQLHFWNKVKKYSMKDFDDLISNYPYRFDLLHGLVDSSFNPKHPEYFFEILKNGRDCDDFARIWRMWAEENNFKQVDEVVVTDIRTPVKKAHVISIGEDSNSKYWLFDYNHYGPFSSFDKAIEKMYRYYDKENFIYKIYEYSKEKY